MGSAPLLGIEVHEQDGDVRRRHARNPRGLPHRARPDAGQLLSRFHREARQLHVIEILRQFPTFEPLLALNELVLLSDVARVLDLNLHLFLHLGVDLDASARIDLPNLLV